MLVPSTSVFPWSLRMNHAIGTEIRGKVRFGDLEDDAFSRPGGMDAVLFQFIPI